jgi:hypothetical protein
MEDLITFFNAAPSAKLMVNQGRGFDAALARPGCRMKRDGTLHGVGKFSGGPAARLPGPVALRACIAAGVPLAENPQREIDARDMPF